MEVCNICFCANFVIKYTIHESKTEYYDRVRTFIP